METIKIENEQLKVHVGSRKYLAPHEMIHLESDLNYTVIYLIDGKKIVSSTTLKIIESRLTPFKNFIRINRQSLVNIDLVTRIEGQACVLANNKTLIFSRRKNKQWQIAKAI